MKIFIVIPAWCEEKNIGNVVDQVKKYYENVVVVDDGSPDNTGQIALSHGATVLSHPINRGQGASLQTGDDYAYSNGADVVVHFDADGQHRAEDIEKLVTRISKGDVDIVLGSRFIGNTHSNIPLTKKYFILPIARLINYIFTGIKLTDGHNGWRAMNRNALQKIQITQDRMAHNTEIPYLIAKHKLRYVEIPMQTVYLEYGQGILGGIKVLEDLIKAKIFK